MRELVEIPESISEKKLIEEHNLIVKSQSDCEVILALYLKYGNTFYNLLNSEHACVIIDIEKNINTFFYFIFCFR